MATRKRGRPLADEDKKPENPSSNDQSGSTGRRAADETVPADKDTGQDHYGQSGFAGSADGIERKTRRPK